MDGIGGMAERVECQVHSEWTRHPDDGSLRRLYWYGQFLEVSLVGYVLGSLGAGVVIFCPYGMRAHKSIARDQQVH
jgi:hypothetical protein